MNRWMQICLVVATLEMLALDVFLLWAEFNAGTHAHGLATLLLFSSYFPLLLLLTGWRRLNPATMPSRITHALRLATVAVTAGYALLGLLALKLIAGVSF